MTCANTVKQRKISGKVAGHSLTSILNLIGTEPIGKSCTMTVRVFVDLRGIGKERELYVHRPQARQGRLMGRRAQENEKSRLRDAPHPAINKK